MNPLKCKWVPLTARGEGPDAPLTLVPEHWLHRAEITANAPPPTILPDHPDDDTNDDELVSPTTTSRLPDSIFIPVPFSEAATSGSTDDKDRDFISRILASDGLSIDYANELPAPIDLQFVASLVEWELKRVVNMLQQRAGFDFTRARPAIQTKSTKRNVHEAQILGVGVPGRSRDCMVHLRVAVSIKRGQITRTLKMRS